LRIGGKLEALTPKMQPGYAQKLRKFRHHTHFFRGFTGLFVSESPQPACKSIWLPGHIAFYKIFFGNELRAFLPSGEVPSSGLPISERIPQ